MFVVVVVVVVVLVGIVSVIMILRIKKLPCCPAKLRSMNRSMVDGGFDTQEEQKGNTENDRGPGKGTIVVVLAFDFFL